MAAVAETNDYQSTGWFTRRKLTAVLLKRKYLVVAIMSLANFANSAVFSCIAPFFPKQAAEVNVTQTEVGIVFGVFQLVTFVASPVVGQKLNTGGAKPYFIFGCILGAATTAAFGFLQFIKNRIVYVSYAMIVRALEGLASAAFMTASLAIISSIFPATVATMIGFIEIFTGIGFSLGPPVGGALYEVGNFITPFAVLSALLLIAGFLALLVVPTDTAQHEAPSWKTALSMLTIPGILVSMMTDFMALASISFMDSTLERHVASFGFSAFVLGLLFMICAIAYSTFSFGFGALVDRKPWWLQSMLFGTAFQALAFLLIGPVPFIPLPKSMDTVATSLAVLGFGMAAAFVPSFSFALRSAYERDYPKSLKTYSIVSGLFQAFYALGSFVGSTCGSLLVDQIGFPWTAFVVAMVNVFQCVWITGVMVVRRPCRKSTVEISLISSSKYRLNGSRK